MAADAWRVRAALELAARGGTPLEAFAIGRVTVDFYITEDGTVRLPSVSPYDDSQLTALAIDALRQWKFEPPTHNGNPTLVKATQVFSFNPAK